MSKRSLLRSHLPECEEGGDARDALGFFILTQGSFTCDVGLFYMSNRSLFQVTSEEVMQEMHCVCALRL